MHPTGKWSMASDMAAVGWHRWRSGVDERFIRNAARSTGNIFDFKVKCIPDQLHIILNEPSLQ